MHESSVETLLGLVGAPGVENEFSLPISSETVQRWACDSNLSRVLMQDSVVIDVGRSKRVVSSAARRALVARDGHCRWPACDRPASWCDGHHLVSWIGGGATDLDNLVLLCGRHHRMVHEGGWQLVKTDGGNLVTIAPTVTFGRPRAAGLSPGGAARAPPVRRAAVESRRWRASAPTARLTIRALRRSTHGTQGLRLRRT